MSILRLWFSHMDVHSIQFRGVYLHLFDVCHDTFSLTMFALREQKKTAAQRKGG